MISAKEMAEKTKEVYKRKLEEELQMIEAECLSIACDEEKKGLIYEAYFDDISKGAQDVLSQNFYTVSVVQKKGGCKGFCVSWR